MLILITEITGSLGQRLAKIAISRGLSVRGLGRTPDKLAPGLSSQLESFVRTASYYDIPALEKAVAGIDVVINAYSPSPELDLDGHLLLIRAAERAQIKIFIASSWSRDWTNIKFGDFEHYNNHIALFADLLFTPYGPGGFDTSGESPKMRYWGNGTADKWPWSTQDDAAEWTIDILLHEECVQAGQGGFFKISSGVTTIKELAEMYELVFETKVGVLRKQNRTGYFGYMSEAAAVLASKGLWENKDVTVLNQFRKPTPLEQYLRETKKGQ
ncbi:hypothetical protein GGR58DRAFT_519652 [Xylaria digitata]|nr:hypothetical protein GGR58DRAFT_519652 [Xylaria digitata]